MTHESAADAVTSVFRSSHPWLVRYAATFVGSIDAAEDVVQEALLLLYAELRGGRRIENMRAWTATVVRRRAAHLGAELRAIAPLSVESADLSSLGAEPNAAARDLERLLGELSEREREILFLRLSAMKYREIADELGLTVNTISGLMARAMRKLRARAGVRAEPPLANETPRSEVGDAGPRES